MTTQWLHSSSSSSKILYGAFFISISKGTHIIVHSYGLYLSSCILSLLSHFNLFNLVIKHFLQKTETFTPPFSDFKLLLPFFFCFPVSVAWQPSKSAAVMGCIGEYLGSNVLTSSWNPLVLMTENSHEHTDALCEVSCTPLILHVNVLLIV